MNQELLEYIEEYLEGKVSREELESRAENAGINNLDQEINWVRDAQFVASVSGLREQLDEILPKNNVQHKKTTKVRSLRLVWAAAAAIAIVVIGYIGWLQTERNDLYSKYVFNDPGLPVVMGESDRYDLDDALSYYGEGNYSIAIEKLEVLNETNIGNDTVQYYLGLSYLYNGQSSKASEMFAQVVDQDSSSFDQKAEWLIIMASLQSKDYSKAQLQLKPVLDNPDHPFHDKALELASELENL